MNSYLVREGRSHTFNILPSDRITKSLDLRHGVTIKRKRRYRSVFDQLQNKLLLSLIETMHI